VEITPVPRPPPTFTRGRVLGAFLVIGPVIVLVFLPTVMGLQRYVVADSAMEGDADGSIGRGAVALARDVPATDLVVGDVITFRPPVDDGPSPDGLVTRRIVSIEDGIAVTRGDNQDLSDPWRLDVTSDTYPRVVLAVPWIGYPFSGGAGEGGWLVLVAAIAVALSLAVITPWRRRRQRHARRQLTHAGVS
jgi:signal peptidase I